MELVKDPKIKAEFELLIINHIVRPDDKKKYEHRFVGGLPVTLERKDVQELLFKINDKYKYTVTQKVDGVRMLLFIGKDISDKDSSLKKRIVIFVDRKLNFYTVRNSERDILPYVDTREMLIDGELIFFDADGKSHKSLDFTYVKGVSFMAFDILYGPSSVSIDGILNEKHLELGQDSSMVVPIDGVLRTHPWTYIDRYKILYNLIIPNYLNNNKAIITEAFKSKNWFNVEIKPIYFLDDIKNYPNLYTQSGNGGLQRSLNSSRKAFYGVIGKMYGKTVNVFIKTPVQLDGLIFTASDTLYTIGSWDKPETTQYKWKPSDEQTIDFMIKKTSNKMGNNHIINLYIYANKKLVPFNSNGRPVISIITPDTFHNIKDNSIGEFSIVNGKYNLVVLRPDKDRPNALHVVLNVLNSIKHPVDINDLLLFLNKENANKTVLQKLLTYPDRTSLLRCISNNDKLSIIPEDKIRPIQEQLVLFFGNKDIELEFRVGKINNVSKSFNPNITETKYKNAINLLSRIWNSTTSDLVDVSSEGIRSRYIYSSDFSKYILFESIKKTRLSNIDIDLSTVLPFDIRVSTSTEINSNRIISSNDAIGKFRTTFTEPNKLFQVDITQIQSGKFIDRVFSPNGDKTFQIEIEIISKSIQIKTITQFLTGFLGKI